MKPQVAGVVLGLSALVLAGCNQPIVNVAEPVPAVEVVEGMFHVEFLIQTTDAKATGGTIDATRITFHPNYIRVEMEPMGTGRIFPMDGLKGFKWTSMTAAEVERVQKSIETFKKASESSSGSPDH